MKILLTGGAGFIGSHLAGRLLADGHRVVVLDNFNDYYSPALKENNLEGILSQSGMELARGDIRDRELVERLFQPNGFEAVIHLAARAGVRPSLQSPRLYQDVNVSGTLNLLESARRFGIKKFVFASSSSVYGDCPRQPLRESEPDLFPVSPYGLTKLIGEYLVRVFHREYGFPTVALRFFTVYGPRQRPDMAIHKFSRLMREGEEIPVFGDGTSRRDYTYIDDIIEGIIGALEADIDFEIFNLGGGHSITLSGLIELLGDEFGISPRLKYLPFQTGDVTATLASVDRAAAVFGYRPRTRIEAGIKKFADWFRRQD